jgi:hypothetical protein
MSETQPEADAGKTSRTVLFVWALLASVAAVTFALTTLFCLVYYGPARGRQEAPAPAPPLATTTEPAETRVAAEPVIKVLKKTTPKDFWPGPADENNYAQSNAVGIVLGEVETGTGLLLLDSERDGLTVVTNVNGKACRAMNPTQRMRSDPMASGYVYFVIHPTFKVPEAKNFKIEVEYCGEPGDFAIEFDALAAQKTGSAAYKRANPAGRLTTEGDWKTATFLIRNAAFENSQNGGADFRLSVRPPALCVRRVTVTREAEPTAIPRPPPREAR